MQGHFLADIGKSIIAAGVVAVPSYFLGIPLILAYILAGVIIGPYLGFGFIQNLESISNLSEIGLVLLLFILGLEINLKKLLRAGRAVLLSAGVQIFGSVMLAYLYFSLFGYGENKFQIVYLGVACALSSTLIVVKILSDEMNLDSLPSRITLGILVLQDLFAIGFLAVQPSLENLNPSALLVSFAKVALLVLISWALARFILPSIFKKTGRQPELMLILAMAWCFAMCGTANYLGLSVEMGALVAGISIAAFPYHLDVAAKISSLRDFFITLFFVGLGLQIPMPTAEVLYLTALIVVFIFVSRFLLIYPTLHRLGFANRASLLPSINLSQISEFSLVLAALGISYKHISPMLLHAFIFALVITSLISSFMIPAAHAIYLKLNPILMQMGFNDHVSEAMKKSDSKVSEQNTKIVILGFYRAASSLLFEMSNRYSKEYVDQLLVVDFNPEVHQELKKNGIRCQYGDISNIDTLRSLNLHNAEVIVCSIPDKILKGTTNLKILKMLKQLAPKACIIVTAEDINLAKEMYANGASYVFIPRFIEANYLVEVIERLQVNGEGSIRDGAVEYLKDRIEIIP